MADLNYFRVLCFAWALVGVVSRGLIVGLGERWNKWEMEQAYSERKPGWVYAVGAGLVVLLGATWYQVVGGDVEHSWIIAALVSLTAVKVYAVVFEYAKFRAFVVRALASPATMRQINLGVLLLSAILIGMGVFIY
ncbi:MAG: hypothetical protein M0Z94_15865 [Dehalococcoidales bacterium]|nr:hypothetical protein [Dehalococcoidales bacterium]